MTTATASFAFAHTSDATFRAWGKGVSDLLAAVGLTRTADTGQVDWATVLRPGINTDAGYEMWRFADTLQATAPVFIKVTYGTAATASIPRLLLQVGAASSGSGALSGAVSAVTATQLAASSSTSGCSACLTDGCLALSLFTINAQVFTVERLRDDTGAVTADGTVLYWRSTAIPGYSLYTAQAGSWTAALTPPWVLPRIESPLLATANVVPVVPVAYYTGQVADPVKPALGLVGIALNDLAADSTFSLSRFGSSRTYRKTPAANCDATGSANASVALLWE